MDPDCAICHQPALAQCDCEAKGLDLAVRQAEQRMMASVFSDIRSWVRGHAQDYILEYFSVLTTRRKDAHAAHIAQITEHAAYYYRARPHPNEVAVANSELKRGIDEDWRASVQRYPEVLEYFYSLVDLNLPSDDDPAVKDPPLSALSGGARKARHRTIEETHRWKASERARKAAPPLHTRRSSTPYAPPPPSYGYGGSAY